MRTQLCTTALLLALWGGCGHGRAPTPSPSPGTPDLAFTGRHEFRFERTLPPTGNDLYTILVEVRNQGDAPARSVQVTGHSKGPGLEGDRPPTGGQGGYYDIAAGQTVWTEFQFIFEKPFSGEYQFSFAIDPSNQIAELDKRNNRLEFSRTF